jgi:hypothetical protein
LEHRQQPFSFTAVPEPSAVALTALGGLRFGFRRWKISEYVTCMFGCLSWELPELMQDVSHSHQGISIGSESYLSIVDTMPEN